MLGEVSMQLDKAREEYLDAKKAYEEFRDGYMPYLDDKEEYERRLEELMYKMDVAEDFYELSRMEHDSVLTEDFRNSDYYELHHKKTFFKSHLEELYDIAVEAKQRYDDLVEGRVPSPPDKGQLASELERLRHEWQMALDDYDAEHTRLLLAQKKAELEK